MQKKFFFRPMPVGDVSQFFWVWLLQIKWTRSDLITAGRLQKFVYKQSKYTHSKTASQMIL